VRGHKRIEHGIRSSSSHSITVLSILFRTVSTLFTVLADFFAQGPLYALNDLIRNRIQSLRPKRRNQMNAADRLLCRDATRFLPICSCVSIEPVLDSGQLRLGDFPTFSRCLGTWDTDTLSLNSHSLKRACRFSVDVTRFTVDGKPHDLVSHPPGVLLRIDQTLYFRFVNPGAGARPRNSWHISAICLPL
jgi:hypothetical protein